MMTNEILHKQITLAIEGDQIAFSYLLNKFWNNVYIFLLQKINNETLAEDLTITTFSKAFDKLDSYNNQYEFKTWLLTIAKNLMIDEFRKKHQTTISIDDQETHGLKFLDDSPSVEDVLINEQDLAQLKRHIQQLKPKYQEVINLRYFEDFSYLEIADQLQEPLNNVKVKLLRSKKILTELILNSNNES